MSMPNSPVATVTRELTECCWCFYYPYLAGIDLKLVEEAGFQARG
jgi:hypothetical protein